MGEPQRNSNTPAEEQRLQWQKIEAIVAQLHEVRNQIVVLDDLADRLAESVQELAAQFDCGRYNVTRVIG